jgi:hypothetical protein
MRQLVMTTLTAALAAISFLESAWTQECSHVPPPGSAERKAILGTLRGPVQRELKQDVVFLAKKFAACRGWAFLEAEPQQPNGRPIDWSRTPYRAAMEEGLCGGHVDALLVKEKGHWRVRIYEICASDVPWVTWSEEYGAPSELFPTID